MSKTRKVAIAATVLLLIAALVITLGVVHSPVDPMIFLDGDMHQGGFFGGLLAAVIVGVVMLMVGLILTVVFTGVGLLLLCVGLGVTALLLTLAIPVLLPALALLAVPFLVLYGLFRLATRSQRASQPVA